MTPPISLLVAEVKFQSPKFPTECFFLTAMCHHITLSPVLRRYKEVLKEIHRLKHVIIINSHNIFVVIYTSIFILVTNSNDLVMMS